MGKDANFDNVRTSCDNLARAIGEGQVIPAELSLLYAWGMSDKDVRDQLVQTTKSMLQASEYASSHWMLPCVRRFMEGMEQPSV